MRTSILLVALLVLVGCEGDTVVNQIVDVEQPKACGGNCGSGGSTTLSLSCSPSACVNGQCSAVTCTWSDGNMYRVCLAEAGFRQCSQLQPSGTPFDAEVNGPVRNVTPTLETSTGAVIATAPTVTTQS